MINITCALLVLFIEKGLDIFQKLVIFRKVFIYRGVEQLVARWAHNPKVVGSNPTPATK